jgi:hypothetical protein
MSDKPVLMLVGTSIPYFGSPEIIEQKKEKYVDWYKNVHIPLALKSPGMVGANFYQCTEPKKEYPEFLCVYELENKQVVEKAMKSPEMMKAIEDGHQNGPIHGMIVRWHVVYEAV